jgi:lethal(2) giant larvae protein
LAVKKIQLCPKTGTLVIAGTAGNVVVANFDSESDDKPIKTVTMNLVSDRDGFVWKGHDQLKVRSHLLEEPVSLIEGLQFSTVLQVLPPAAITCVALQSKWGVVAAGTAHGLVLFDYQNAAPVLHKCMLNPNDLTGAGEALSRRKSFKKTLRESFRRLRKGRSTRNNPSAQQTPAETRPVERQIEARPVDDGMGSMVRCLTFAQTFVANLHSTMPTLWAGTNASFISIFVLHIPNKPAEEADPPAPQKPITGQLAKEIHLKHRAPVISISLFDNHGVPLEFQDTIALNSGPHRVLIASEEQFKVFSLPQLKPITKYKLTAHEGARVRKLAYATFSCSVPASLLQPSPTKQAAIDVPASSEVVTHAEINVLCLTNLGDCLVLSVPELKRQLNAAAVRREDIK